jgi:hypothetical protein
MIRRYALALVLMFLPAAAYPVCSPGASRPPSSNTPDYVHLIPDSTMAPYIDDAMNAWGSCTTNNRPGFPYPETAPLWNAYYSQLNVVFHSGFNPSNNNSCGSTSGSNINVYQVAFKPGTTTTVQCSSYGYSQIIEHELGHYYGLADITDPGCTDIMAQLDGSPHTVTLSDCNKANDQNQTYSENNPIDYSCQQPCYTTCVAGNCPAQNGGSPIIFDLDNQGFRLSGSDAPVLFDLYTKGLPIWTSWTACGSNTAFLALDLNRNGKIDDAGELFGNHTRLADGTFALNGFEALAQYDELANGGNADGLIDASDVIFDKLRLWTDANHNGQTDPGELQTLPQAGIVSIALDYKLAVKRDLNGNRFRYRGHATQQHGRQQHEVTIYDVFFAPVLGGAPSTPPSCAGQPAPAFSFPPR